MPGTASGTCWVARASLASPPSLHHLRRRLPGIVRQLRWYYEVIRLPTLVHPRRTALAFPGRPVPDQLDGRTWDLPVLAQGGSVHARVLRPRGVRLRLAHSAAADVAFDVCDRLGTPDMLISRRNSPACTCPCERFAAPSRVANASLGVTVGRWPFGVELFHLLLLAGLSRRFPQPRVVTRPSRPSAAVSPGQHHFLPPMHAYHLSKSGYTVAGNGSCREEQPGDAGGPIQLRQRARRG